MEYLHYDLGSLARGDVVEVTLTAGANVMLMDSHNLSRYKRSQTFQYIGGLAKQSPVRLQVPSSGRWHCVVDTRGLRNSTSASVQVIKAAALQPLPPIREQHASLSEIAANAAALIDQDELDREFDVFISHASEDKDGVVRPLADALVAQGLDVWYDELVLRVGDSLRRKIDAGIARSRFGVVVLSKAFFAKSWPQYELDGLVTMSLSGRQIILPLWHEISKDEVISQSPSLADKVALRTSDYSIEEIAAELAAVIRERDRN